MLLSINDGRGNAHWYEFWVSVMGVFCGLFPCLITSEKDWGMGIAEEAIITATLIYGGISMAEYDILRATREGA